MRRLTPKVRTTLCGSLQTVTTGSLAIGVIMPRYYLLVIAALRVGEGSDLPQAEGGHDCRLVPIEDVGALFAPLPKGHYRAPLVDDQASRHLYRHLSHPAEELPLNHRDTEAIVPESRLLPAEPGSTSLPVVSIEGHGLRHP